MGTATITMQPHYSILELDSVVALRSLFPSGRADEMNFALFSTSGVHGNYRTIEDVEAQLKKGKEESAQLTVTVVHPRIICMRYGNIAVTLDDIDYLKKLRASSWAIVPTIGAD